MSGTLLSSQGRAGSFPVAGSWPVQGWHWEQGSVYPWVCGARFSWPLGSLALAVGATAHGLALQWPIGQVRTCFLQFIGCFYKIYLPTMAEAPSWLCVRQQHRGGSKPLSNKGVKYKQHKPRQSIPQTLPHLKAQSGTRA